MSFLGARLALLQLRLAVPEYVVTSQSFLGSTVESSYWCFRLCHAARDIEGHRNKLACQFLWLNRHVSQAPYLDPKLKISCIA